jgi:hypothetical protein
MEHNGNTCGISISIMSNTIDIYGIAMVDLIAIIEDSIILTIKRAMVKEPHESVLTFVPAGKHRHVTA